MPLYISETLSSRLRASWSLIVLSRCNHYQSYLNALIQFHCKPHSLSRLSLSFASSQWVLQEWHVEVHPQQGTNGTMVAHGPLFVPCL
jgi:hypothetical protein